MSGRAHQPLAVVCWILLTLLAGCVSKPDAVAPVPYKDLREAQAILVQRQQAIENLQARCKMQITDERGDRHRFDAAVVFQGQTQTRLRAWKLSTTLVDATVNEDGIWLLVSDELTDRAPESADQLKELTEQLSALLRGPDYAEADLHGPDDKGLGASQIVAQWPGVWAEIDARTLTPKVFHFTDEESRGLERVETRYTEYNGIAWPWRIDVYGAFGQLRLDFSDVEINSELNPRAFKPPRRAVKQ